MLTNRVETYFERLRSIQEELPTSRKMKEVPEAFPQNIVDMLIEGALWGKLRVTNGTSFGQSHPRNRGLYRKSPTAP